MASIKPLLNLAGLLDCVTAEHTLAIEGDEVASTRGAGKADEPRGWPADARRDRFE